MSDAQARTADYLRLLQRSGYLVIPSPPSIPDSHERILSDIAICRACGLHRTRKNVVPGEGHPAAKLVFVGEAPGFDEDASGRPFVGEAGGLLDKMIAAMNFKREEVHILNVVKCRPPGNRDPLPEEIACCIEFLKRQLGVIRPVLIVTLGRFASQTLLNTSTSISQLRGKWGEYNGIKVMPTFHPSYLLRSPNEKRKVWSDLQEVMAEYERLVGFRRQAHS